jgi:Ser-tRNA(Ala) deacylase AlaX/signal transduction histidine kinase
MASALTRHPAVMTLDRATSDRLFAGVLRSQPLLLNILLTDRNATLKGTGLPVRPELGPTVTMPYVQAVVSSGNAQISELTTGQVSGKPTVVLAYPVRQEGHTDVVGVLALGINLTEMQTLFRDIPLPEGSVVTLTDAESRVLARSRDADLYIGKALGTAAPPKDVPGRRVMTGPDGVPRFYGNAVIGRGPWLLSVGIPTSVAVSRLAPLFLRNIIISSVGIVAVLLLSLGLSTLIGAVSAAFATPCSASPTATSRRRSGRPVPNLELAQLQNAFITMAANLRETQEKLDRQFEQERKVRETLQSLQRQVVRQERLAAVGVLVSGVAHELNNPLQAILGTAELLERRGGLSDDALEEIAFVKTQAGRAREIIRNLSRFSSQQSGPPALVDLRDVIGEVVQLRRRDLDAGTIALDIETSTTRTVYANFTELEQVMLNFVINAQQSIEAVGRTKGRILIRLFDVGKRVRLEVHDDGPGVTRKTSRSSSSRSSPRSRSGRAPASGCRSATASSSRTADRSGTRAINGAAPPSTSSCRRAIPRATPRPATPRPRPMTDRLYYRDPYLRTFDATVEKVEPHGDRWSVALDRTAFYPTTGGQPFDTGTLGGLRVVDVVDEEDGGITHVVEQPGVGQGSDTCLTPGQQVHGEIDWARRFDHMQQHTGQHVLSAAILSVCRARTVSFHLGAAVSTIDLERELSPADIAAAETEANRVVWEDRPVTIRFVSAEEAAALPLRKEPTRGGTLRLIDVEGFDLSACGGTHVARSGAIGIIAVASGSGSREASASSSCAAAVRWAAGDPFATRSRRASVSCPCCRRRFRRRSSACRATQGNKSVRPRRCRPSSRDFAQGSWPGRRSPSTARSLCFVRSTRMQTA